MDPASRLPVATGSYYELLMKMFTELNTLVSKELSQLERQLEKRTSEAKEKRPERYEEIKEKAEEILRRITFEHGNEIHELGQKLTTEFQESFTLNDRVKQK
ncbi:hypothetical protein QAD02_009399 [Eretmocerus hayati]|uniref:Uncharacterized protein n=1 Tax=Eretmocerus hayati TaxID=131215 RepID=A0ACC2NAL4_9HYME|nr:hypothetical protein QAD02_009399 [Eretmocerus hayati]